MPCRDDLMSMDPRLRHDMESLSTLLMFCAGNPPMAGIFPHNMSVMNRLNVFLNMKLHNFRYWPEYRYEKHKDHVFSYMDSSLTHWGRVTHMCVGKLTRIGSDNSLSPERRQAIIWTNAGILLIGPLGTNFNEILIKILTFLFKKMRLKVSSGKCRPLCLGLNVLKAELYWVPCNLYTANPRAGKVPSSSWTYLMTNDAKFYIRLRHIYVYIHICIWFRFINVWRYVYG